MSSIHRCFMSCSASRVRDKVMITPTQCRAARKLLKWSRQRLADEARLSLTTIWNLEAGTHQLKPANLMAIRRALDSASVTLSKLKS